jgi:hypothetical protein
VIEKEKKDNDVIYVNAPRFSENNQKVARLGAIRVVKDYPLILNIAVTEDFFLAGWRNNVKWIVAISSVAVILLPGCFVIITNMLSHRGVERKAGNTGNL